MGVFPKFFKAIIGQMLIRLPATLLQLVGGLPSEVRKLQLKLGGHLANQAPFIEFFSSQEKSEL